MTIKFNSIGRQPNSIEQLLSQYYVNEDGCHIYHGTGEWVNGYVRVNLDGNRYFIHRLAAHVHHGLDLNNPNQLALHKDDCSRRCINPEHLYIGTHQDNHNDRSRLVTHCPRGHEYNKENTYINKDGSKSCKVCKTILAREYRRRVR